MTLDNFWKTIDEARQTRGSLIDIPARLIEILSQMDEGEIIGFAEHFRGCLHRSYDANLWLGAVVILNGCGDDTFADFRCWLIAQGREAFEAALADPDSMAALERFDGDHGYPLLFYMGSVSKEAFCKRVAANDGDSAAEDRFEELYPVRKYPPLKNREIVNTNEEDAKTLFPKLAARFPNGMRKY